MNLKGLSITEKEKILKEKLLETYPILKDRSFKISWLCPKYFEKTKKYQGSNLMTEEYRVTPSSITINICGIEMIEDIMAYGSAMEFDSPNNVNCFYAVDPDYR
jgi:hypothetical protein